MNNQVESTRMPVGYWYTARMFRVALVFAPILLLGACSPPDTARLAAPSVEGEVMQGQVLDSMTSEALDSFCVSLESLNGNREGRDFQDAGGRFRWEGIPAGIYSVLVTADGYEPNGVHDITVASGGATEEISFPLRTGRTVQGRVTDAVTGEGIAGADVRVPYEPRNSCGDAHFLTVSDDDGYFVLDGMARRALSVEVAASDYASKHVAADETVDEYLQIELSSSAAIYGRLAGPNGAPARAGFVVLTNADMHMVPRRIFTDGQGRFKFLGLRAGTYQIDAVSADWPQVVTKVLTVDQDTVIRDYEIRFGWVTDTTGSSIVGGIVPDVTANTRASASALTDTDIPGTSSVGGRVSGLMADEQAHISIGDSREFADVVEEASYEVRNVPAGAETVVRVHTDMGRKVSDTVDIVEGQKAVLDFALDGTGRLFGRITRGGRATASSVHAWSMGDGPRLTAGVRTSREGDYDIAGLPFGEYQVVVAVRLPFLVQVNGDTWLDVDLCNYPTPRASEPVGGAADCDNLSLSGIVVASEDGRGVESARISIADVTGPFHILTGTDGLGAFEFRDLAPGSYVVTVYRSGYDVVTRPILLQASMEGLAVMLEPSSGQTVSVRNRETGVPLRSVQVEATDGSTTAKFLVRLRGVAGFLPTSLYGHDLTISSDGYRPYRVSGWNGEPLNIEVSTCRAFTEGCYPGPL